MDTTFARTGRGNPGLSNDYYSRWSAPDCVRSFGDKDIGDFFQSETRFLSEIAPRVETVLDVGCASGRFLDLLRQWRENVSFTGVDISAANIANARKLYPEARFEHANALDFCPESKFDLVNATGVMQHEPRFEELIRNMLSWSDRFVLFDVKLAFIEQHIVDRLVSFAGEGADRLYFIILSYPGLRAFLKSLAGIARVSVYGYVTQLNERTHVPDHIGQLVSAGILIEKGEPPRSGPKIEEALPDLIWRSDNA